MPHRCQRRADELRDLTMFSVLSKLGLERRTQAAVLVPRCRMRGLLDQQPGLLGLTSSPQLGGPVLGHDG